MGILDGRVAIVTGAGRGIGGSIAKLFAAEGASVVVNDIGASLSGLEKDGSPGEDLVKEIEAAGGTAVVNGADVGDHEAARDMVESTVEKFGKLDVLVNVAGILRDRMIFNMSEEDWDAVIRVHLKGHFNTIRPAAAYWRSQKNPDLNARLINFTSRAGLHGAPGQPNYSAAKMGIVGLTYACSVSLNRYGVTSNAISPAAATRMTASAAGMADQYEEAADELSPDNVAPIVTWMASEQSGWCNGQVIHSRGYEVNLYSIPAPVATVTHEGGWDLATIGADVEKEFRPIVDSQPKNPFVGG